MEFYILIFVLIVLPPLFVYSYDVLYYYVAYKNSKYFEESGNSFIETIYNTNKRLFFLNFNTGNIGELLTFHKLEKIKDHRKLLTNNYVPDENNLTHESDVILIHPTGIYVFESKNYSGWIYGKETDKYWTQSIYNEENHTKYKSKFYNPIWQNKKHVDTLNDYLENRYTSNIFSYIVFSSRCKLKRLSYSSSHCKIMNRYDLLWYLKNDIKSKDIIFTNEQVDEIYNSLKKCSNVSDEVKQQHIDDINCGAYYLNKENISQEIVEAPKIIETKEVIAVVAPIENIIIAPVVEQKSYDKIVEELREYRKNKSTFEQVPAYFIYNDETLFMLANVKPKTSEELKQIKGLNDYNINRYGEDILNVINNI